MMIRFIVRVRQEETCWRAVVPELPGCCVEVQQEQEISARIEAAIRGYLMSWDATPPRVVELDIRK